MASDQIVVRGAREHNLRGVDVDIPRESLTVVTGVSGSGKSSLAFDTIYKEGQRRFLESLSPYARQFLGQVEKPQVDHLDGLSPAVCVDQKTAGRNPRSTVGTLTETLDHLRLLFARLGVAHCPSCGHVIESQTGEQIADRVLREHQDRRAMVLAPIVQARKGEYRKELASLLKDGWRRVRLDGAIVELDGPEEITLDRYVRHTIEVVIDRVVLRADKRRRVEEAVERALEMASGVVSFLLPAEAEDRGGAMEAHLTYASSRACPDCGFSLPEIEPRLFSFNHPQGACEACNGLGERRRVTEDRVVPEPTLSIRGGALACMTEEGKVPFVRLGMPEIESVANARGIDLDAPWQELSEAHRELLLMGSGRDTFRFAYSFDKGGRKITRDYKATYRGVVKALELAWRYTKAPFLERWMQVEPCPDCAGSRIGAAGRAVTFRERRIFELTGSTVRDLLDFLESVELDDGESLIGRPILKELIGRLSFLVEVGVGYLTLDRRASTLAGGEAQRIRLAAQVGSGLQGVLYVLDEPSIGLHPRDNARLLGTLRKLRDAGNTVLVVEHDEETIRAADHVVDIGPGAGVLGGELVAAGSPGMVADSDGPTGRFLAGRDAIAAPDERRPGNGLALTVIDARHHNLQGITVAFPLGLFCCVTGVSGSGKSTLVERILRRSLAQTFHNAEKRPGDHRSVQGTEHLDKVIVIDQRPIGRTPRSNPATYTKLFDVIRKLFSQVPEARSRGYKPGRFSFNVKGGRCEECEGAGVKVVEMQFLADVQVPCDACEGGRFNPETREIRYKGRTIDEVLDMPVDEAATFFGAVPAAKRILDALVSVGMGYVSLGQPSTTLSGGEAQRIKLASELRRPATGRTLYILDEPTTGLHHADVRTLLEALGRLVDAGNSVLVIEHNLDVIKVADHVIDLGPEGGDGGGRVVASGTPEQVAVAKGSHTGRALAAALAHEVLIEPVAGERKPLLSTGPALVRDIEIKGARTHNLKDVDVRIPGGKMTVVTGVSGSGKTSLAFDTVFAEGQRRYVESLSTYARRFLGRLDKADCESLTGLAPAISIDQKTASRNPRSTVATVTEIHDYLRLLYARVGTPHCPDCADRLEGLSPSAAARLVAQQWNGRRLMVAGSPPLPERLMDAGPQLVSDGRLRVLIEGQPFDLSSGVPEEIAERVDYAVVTDRLRADDDDPRRLAEAIQGAYAIGNGRALIVDGDGQSRVVSEAAECTEHGHVWPLDPSPRMFSFNHHQGACTTCGGLGVVRRVSSDSLVKDPGRTLLSGALIPTVSRLFQQRGRRKRSMLTHVCKSHGINLRQPVSAWSDDERRIVFDGTGGQQYEFVRSRRVTGGSSKVTTQEPWPGIIGLLQERDDSEERVAGHIASNTCLTCRGQRLRPMSLATTLGELNLPALCARTVDEARSFFEGLELDFAGRLIAADPLSEVDGRLSFLQAVGLGYLTLDRSAATLSGGEAQRIRLASQLGARLTGCVYVLDEPTVGLHPRDTERLIHTLHGLRDLGNTVLVVEHDVDVIRASDHLIDLGPGAGVAGGEVVAEGPPMALVPRNGAHSMTAAFLSGERGVPVPRLRRTGTNAIAIRGAHAHNLRSVDARFPFGALTAVTGVSGSGKSSLVMEVLLRALEQRISGAKAPKGPWEEITGLDEVEKVLSVDQSPIGRTPRSNPATFTGVMDRIRSLFAEAPEAKARGFGKGRFSFNVAEGRCAGCDGQGAVKVEMHFLSDVWIRCDACKGRRFNASTLDVKWRGLSIADVLDLEVRRALAHFGNHRAMKRILQSLDDVGLGYVRLGQAATTLSGGEAQRLKLAAELARPGGAGAVYVLDEPTTGLHPADVERLVEVLSRLADKGAAVVVVEHNLDVIKVADQVIDLGPEGGDAGGALVIAGTPEEVARHADSRTGAHLRPLL